MWISSALCENHQIMSARMFTKLVTRTSEQLQASGREISRRKRVGVKGFEYLITDFDAECQIKFLKALKPDTSAPPPLAAPPSPSPPSTPARSTGITAARRQREAEAQALADRQAQAEAYLKLFRALSETNRKSAEYKHFVLEAYDGFARAGGYAGRVKLGRERLSSTGLQRFCDALAGGTLTLPAPVAAFLTRKGVVSLSPKTVREWRAAYDEQGLYGLADHYAVRSGETALTPAQQDFIVAMLYEHPQSGATHYYEGLKSRFKGLRIPGKDTLLRFLNRWKAEHPSLYLYITDPDGWRNKRMFAYGDADEQVTALNARWEADATKADIMCIDGRACVVGIIDVWSRRFRLLVVPTSKAEAIGLLFRRCLLEWGVPKQFRTDNGADFTAFYMERICEALRIAHYLCTEFCPEQKPYIERAFKTFSHGLLELMDGYVGHDVAARKKIEARKSFSKRLMTPGEVIEATLTRETLQKFCDDWCDQVYGQRNHGSLGISPAAKARSWTQPIARITDERALDLLLFPAPSQDGFRVIGKEGVTATFTGVKLNYAAGEMCGHEGEQVRVLIDPTNLGRAVLFAGDGSFFCVAEDARYYGISRADTANHLKNKQKETLSAQRKEMKANAKEYGTRNIAAEIMADKANEAAKLGELPKPAVEYDTPALREAARAVADMERKDAPSRGIGLTPEQERWAALAKQQPRRLPEQPATGLERFNYLQDRVAAGTATPDEQAERERILKGMTGGTLARGAGRRAMG